MLVLAAALLVLTASVVGVGYGAVTVARHRAQAAADFAALAGAQDAYLGDHAACGRAGDWARANDAHLRSCVRDGLTVTVTVEVTSTSASALVGTVGATARAGPVRSG